MVTDRQVNFKSPEFEFILDQINNVVTKYGLMPFKYESAKISFSKFDIGEYGNKSYWRVLSTEFPALRNKSLIDELKQTLFEKFPIYVEKKIVSAYWYKDKTDCWQTGIKILPGSLSDNLFTAKDLNMYSSDPSVKKRLDALEDRMFRRADDTRSKETRFADFKDALAYEFLLTMAPLKKVTNLKLKHSNAIFSIDPDLDTDFCGYINNVYYDKVEGKSHNNTDNFEYVDDYHGHKAFAEYIKSLSLGSFHDAAYVIFVLKPAGDVIIFNPSNLEENWSAGKVSL